MTSANTKLRSERPYIEILQERLNHSLIAREKATDKVRAIRYLIKKEREKIRKAANESGSCTTNQPNKAH